MSVFPSNWESQKANKNLIWKISYWFFDDNLGTKRRKIIKGFHRYETLLEKQEAVQETLDSEMENLQKKGMNEIRQTYSVDTSEISPRTPLLPALEYSLKTHSGDRDTKIDITSSLKYFSIAAKTLKYDMLPVGEVRKKHIKFILDEMGNIKTYLNKQGKEVPKVWNERMYNHTRAIVSLLFGPLVEVDAVELNPVAGVKKKTKLKKIRQLPTEKDREILRTVIKESHYSFYRFIQIFHHSGGRIKELLAVKKKDVNIDLTHINPAKHTQEYKITVKKGGKYQEVMRLIKDTSLPYWQEIIKLAENNDQYLFSAGLLPGYNGGKPIRREQVTRRWNIHLKKKYGITADFYSLKHLNVTEMMDIVRDEKEVAKLTGHTVEKEDNTMAKVYDMNNKRRKDDLLKSVNNQL